MKDKEMTKDEIKKYLIWFLTEAKDWSQKEYRLYEKCYKENPDITEDLIRDNEISWENKKYQWEDMTNSLFRCGRCADIAVEIAEKVVNRMLFPPKERRADEPELNWDDADEKQLRQWLLCRCDELPDTIPLTAAWTMPFAGEPEEAQFAAMSYVTDFTTRHCAYALFRGIDIEFKYPFRALIINREEGYADQVIQDIRNLYAAAFRLSEERIEELIMLGFAATFVGAGKKKQETAFYTKYIDKWMAEDQERFLGIIRNKASAHFRGKILKKLTGSSK
ncbi:MAG TPA: hypothetical protein DCG49_09275 [Ruminococcus sp.]|nr:hypothetical protein [Ruminococcus sp.]